jgi:hypothetical protein
MASISGSKDLESSISLLANKASILLLLSYTAESMS